MKTLADLKKFLEENKDLPNETPLRVIRQFPFQYSPPVDFYVEVSEWYGIETINIKIEN